MSAATLFPAFVAPGLLAGILTVNVGFAQEPDDGTTTAAPSASSQGEQQALEELITSQRSELSRLNDELSALRQEQRALRDSLRTRDTDLIALSERVTYGEAVIVGEGERVEKVVAFGNDVRIAGHVLGDASSLGGDVIVVDGGIVDGDAVSFGGAVKVRPGGLVRGDRITLAAPESAMASSHGGYSVGGFLSGLYSRLIMLLSFAGAGVMVVGLVPDRVGRIASRLETHPIRAGLVGVVTTGFLGLSSLLFAITFIGLPVSLVLMAILGLAWLMGFVGLCQAVGDRLPFQSKHHGRWLAFLVGTLLLTFLGALPWVGFLVVTAASVMGMGAALSTRFGSA